MDDEWILGRPESHGVRASHVLVGQNVEFLLREGRGIMWSMIKNLADFPHLENSLIRECWPTTSPATVRWLDHLAPGILGRCSRGLLKGCADTVKIVLSMHFCVVPLSIVYGTKPV